MPCLNHPQREESWFCPQCQVSFCNDCVDVKMYGHVKVEICPRCKDKVLTIERFRPATPFWNRLPEIFRYPFEDAGWMRLLIIGVVAVFVLGLATIGLMSGTLFGLLGAMGLYTIYYGINISYFYLVISKSEAGDLKPPEWASISGISDLSWPTTQFMLTTLVVFMPGLIFLFILLGAAGFDFSQLGIWIATPPVILALVLFGLLGLAILPMGLLLIGVFRKVSYAWNPIIIFGQIMKIPKEYLAALGFLIILEILSMIVWFVLRFFSIALGGGFFAGVIKIFINSSVNFYFMVVAGHVLGYLAYQCRFQLGWWHDTQAASRPAMPETVAAARSQAHPDLVEGFRYLKQGSLDLSESSFQAVLQAEPDNREALRGLVDLAKERQDEAGVKKWAGKFLDLALRQQDLEGALAVYQEMGSAFPALALEPRAQLALAKALREKERFFEAASLLRQFAVNFPDDPRAPKALYQCGELLLKQEGQAENARKIWEYILQRYPGHELTRHVEAGLKQIPGR